jgi:hypothetical protein
LDAFGRRDAAPLRAQALILLPLAISSIVMAVLAVWARVTMHCLWRSWLTRQLFDAAPRNLLWIGLTGPRGPRVCARLTDGPSRP